MIGDIIGSRGLAPDARRAVQTRIARLCGGGVGFRVSGGDEFEWALDDAPTALDEALLLRARLAVPEGDAEAVTLRCAFGRGEVHVLDADPYGQDGPAYHRARAGMSETLRAPPAGRRSGRDPFEPGAHQGARLTSFDDGRSAPARDALLAHMDAIMARWTAAQWEAIAAALEGLTYEVAGERLGVSAQAVSNRVKAAQLDLFLVGHAAIKASSWPTSGEGG